jgi:hypothetical protein
MRQLYYELLKAARFAAIGVAAAIAFGAGHTYAGEREKGESKSTESEAGEAPEATGAGIKLGAFKIRSDYPAEAQKSTVRFVLYATVSGDHFADMERLAEEHQQKIRDEIIIATRLTPLSLFEEPDLAVFRRRILIRLRRTLPDLTIDRLYVTDFGLKVKSL